MELFPSHDRAGSTRSFTFSSAHISEFAFFDDQDDLLANVVASVGNGQIVIETTPNGPGDKYHELILGSPQNDWHVCFFPWYKHKRYQAKSQFHHPNIPDMDRNEEKMMMQLGLSKGQMYWRRTQVTTMGLEKFKREYPSSIDEAFMSSQTLFYPTDVVDRIKLIPFKGKIWECDDSIINDRDWETLS